MLAGPACSLRRAPPPARLLSAFALRNGSGLPLARARRRFALPSGASREPLALLACLCDATV